MDKHGGNIHHLPMEILDFSANIHPDGVPEKIKTAMEHALSMVLHYPDPKYCNLKKAISQKENQKQEWIVCGNGAADLLYRLAMLKQPKKILLPVPAFVEYEEAFTMPAVERPEIIPYVLDQTDFLLDSGIISLMKEDIDLMILCNPNNPTGQLIDQELLEKILEKAQEQKIFILLDECFLNFVIDGEERSKKGCLREYKHVFILKSFTKMYAIAGIRLGYGICSDETVIRQLEQMAPAWTINHIAQEAGIAACQMEGYEEETAKKVAILREALYEELKKLPLKIWMGSANYLFFQIEGCTDFRERCLKKNICIRQCHNYRGIGTDYYRIAVRTEKENKQLIQVFKTIFEEGI